MYHATLDVRRPYRASFFRDPCRERVYSRDTLDRQPTVKYARRLRWNFHDRVDLVLRIERILIRWIPFSHDDIESYNWLNEHCFYGILI